MHQTKKAQSSCHGAPLGADEIAAARAKLGWEHDAFVVPDDIYAGWDGKVSGAKAQQAWEDLFAAYAEAYQRLRLNTTVA